MLVYTNIPRKREKHSKLNAPNSEQRPTDQPIFFLIHRERYLETDSSPVDFYEKHVRWGKVGSVVSHKR